MSSDLIWGTYAVNGVSNGSFSVSQMDHTPVLFVLEWSRRENVAWQQPLLRKKPVDARGCFGCASAIRRRLPSREHNQLVWPSDQGGRLRDRALSICRFCFERGTTPSVDDWHLVSDGAAARSTLHSQLEQTVGSVRSNGAPRRPVSFYRLSAICQPTTENLVAGARNPLNLEFSWAAA
jgi:hypothetical protein